MSTSTIVCLLGTFPIFSRQLRLNRFSRSSFSYVAAALLSTVFLLIGQSATVSKHRRLAKIDYPRLYADNTEMANSPAAIRFNCVQRAHQNTLENIPQIYLMTVLVGVKQPVLAASAVGLWVVSRIVYTRGYASGNPAKRNSKFSMMCYIPAMLTFTLGSIYSVYTLVSEGI
ncbi:hypothetical protein B0H13DRAFT_2356063 [Mycena leptocephala]|nr:hypothetical protein B0H13DRAFT_2356063 [Mycena leptocephala]